MPWRVTFLAAWVLAVGCASTDDLYRWGEYETLLASSAEMAGGADPAAQLQRVAADVAQTEATGGRVPPGVHAQLGFLYAREGDREAARLHLLRERALFPESSVFVDSILSRLEDQPPAPSAEL